MYSVSLWEKKIPGPRANAFVKRLATVILQLEHNDALGGLMELKNILKVSFIFPNM